jgi:hypothetical protein
MRTLGIITSLVGAAIVLGGVVLGIKSIPDIQRYVKMRQM